MAFENLKSTGIAYLLGKIKTYLDATYQKIASAVLTVNSTGPDQYGNVLINRVNYAGDLESSFTQTSSGEFLQRTSGGSASIKDGDAWLGNVIGNSIHEGFVAQFLDMEVSEVGDDGHITATIDEDTFFANQSLPNSPINLVFSTAWNTDPTTYGVTVTGSPVAGDQITITYVREVPGTITNATPTSFVSTGWNLYQSANGYAKVVRYSDEYGYGISGDYTALQFSTTVNGEKTSITAEDGLFNPESDGYVWVTGGNASNTAIWPTWSDWTDSYQGDFQGFTKTEIDLSEVMNEYFSNGLCKVGNVYDEINLSLGVAIVRIEQMENNSTNMATAKSSGRLFDYDETTIYIVKASEATHSIDVSGSYSASQYGIEYFVGSSVPVGAQTIYGMNLKNKLERDVVTISGDIVDNLSTNDSQKVLSAKQGKVLNDKLTDLFKTITYSYKYSVNAGANASITRTNFGMATPSGYKVLSLRGVYTGSKYVSVCNADPTTENCMYVFNASASNRPDITAKMIVTYIKSGFGI